MITRFEITEEHEDGGMVTIETDTGEKFEIDVFTDEDGQVSLVLNQHYFEQEALNGVILRRGLGR